MAWVIEPIDPESHQIREVFAIYGHAMFMAQGLERTLGIALATVYGPEKITREQFDDFLEFNFKQTLGTLIKKMRKTVELSEELEQMLSEALEKRNWLAHRYFWERAKTLASAEGQRTMVEELEKISDFFENVDSIFMRILMKWGGKRGVTQEVVDRIIIESMDSEVTQEMVERIMRESMDSK